MPHSLIPASLEAFIDALPDPHAARRFAQRLTEEAPSLTALLTTNADLLSRTLLIASHSSWLSETILRRPEFVEWLASETLAVAPSPEAVRESLAKYARVNGDVDVTTRLSRFQRREWTRIYLRDCLHVCPLAEIVEDLSHVADAILDYALQESLTEIAAQHGAPYRIDERGRRAPASLVILALGKLGSRELNYASDIDVMFLHSGHGETGGGPRGITSNADFFRKVAERTLKLVGSKTAPEGPAFRVDVRLRPYGQDGPLVIPLAEAVTYYQEKAQNWERLAMLRARGAAGDIDLANRFLASIRSAVFLAEPLADALRDVRLSKEKIDRKQALRSGGYNVKLGKGGIREIEFIAQALQVCYGGRDAWLRAPQTLIALQRLAEKGYLTKTERMHLTDAYVFLRQCEHRIQMEHGAQSHSLPLDDDRLDLLARRLGFFGETARRDFLQALSEHRDRVTAAYQRVFAETHAVEAPPPIIAHPLAASPETTLRETLVSLLTRSDSGIAPQSSAFWKDRLDEVAQVAPDPHQCLTLLRNVITSWETNVRDAATSSGDIRPAIAPLSVDAVREAATLCQSGEFFAHRLMQNPRLLAALETAPAPVGGAPAPFHEIFSRAGARSRTLAEINAVLRHLHLRTLFDIGRLDVSGALTLRQTNLAQSALADAVLDAAARFAIRAAGRTTDFPVWCCMALGRLGHQGLDYGSDLDLIFVYDDAANGDDARLRTIRLAESLIGMLSAMTQEGTLYRIDVRLRPEGRNGPLAVGKRALLRYLAERAAVWERLAYLKMRPVTGDATFGNAVQRETREAIFDVGASRLEELRRESSAMRLRLEHERAGRNPQQNFKFGPGGMMDVYFVTRYIQIRDRIADSPEYGTIPLIERLGQSGAIDPESAKTLRDGYAFLRGLDHALRLHFERPTARIPPHSQAISKRLGFRTADEFERTYAHMTQAIRAVYQAVL
jgi:[glutamine synthetase] adenylyltransferase / [glutamine synthetase]-adenylyl-L-tyrosine phosphorylase